MINIHSFFKLSVTALFIISVTGCGSESDTTDLAKAIQLDKLRSEGTIIESVKIVGDQQRLKPGETLQLSATGIDSNGDTRDITSELTWESNDPTIATVNSNGVVNAVSSTTANQGPVSITGTTINDISGEGEVSVSDVAVTEINLKTAASNIDYINTCIPAQLSADLTYADGYTSLNTIRGLSFAVDNGSTATINSDGLLFTSAPDVEDTTITAKIDNVLGKLTVKADPKNLESIDILVNDEPTEEINLNIGDRIQVSAIASLVTQEPNTINDTITWSQVGTRYIGITDEGENKGTLVALKSGETQLIGSCGNKQKIITVTVDGSDDLNDLQINDGSTALTMTPLGSINLTLTANGSDETSSVNVTEFADWSINGSSLVTTKLISTGTENAVYRLTSKTNSAGSFIVSATYDNQVSSVQVNIE